MSAKSFNVQMILSNKSLCLFLDVINEQVFVYSAIDLSILLTSKECSFRILCFLCDLIYALKQTCFIIYNNMYNV